MSSDLDAIKRVIEAFERSDWSEIDVRSGPIRVHLSARPNDADLRGDAVLPGDAVSSSAISSGSEISRLDPAVPTPNAIRPIDVPPGAQVVASPSPGIFWRAPEPGAPPFADIGQAVDTASTLCIVEVMKLMNHIKAGVAGKVVAVFVEDGIAVDRGEALFAVVPSVGGAET